MKKNVSKNFTWDELTYSRIAVENGLSNELPDYARRSLQVLVDRLLQPLREQYGCPIAITSGYRTPEINLLAGGVPSSQHQRGEAVDCYVPDIFRLLDILKKSDLPFDQAILYARKNILHLSLKAKGENRHQVLYK